MDLDSFLVSLYVLVDDWWKADHPSTAPRKPGRPALLSESEVLTLAFPQPSGPASEAREISGASLGPTCALTCPCCAPRASSIGAAVLRPRARLSFGRLSRDGHHPPAGDGEGFWQGALLRAGYLREERLQDREWVYGFKVALVVDPDGVITAFGLAPLRPPTRGP
jgi:hypothetical protein